MKQEWSNKWTGSRQPRKQRKYRANAPMHVLHKLVTANLSPPLRERYKRRSLPVRKGDEVRVMSGSFRGIKGVVERVELKTQGVYIDSVKVKKTDESEVQRPIQASNIQIISPTLDDKMRVRAIERKAQGPQKGGKAK